MPVTNNNQSREVYNSSFKVKIEDVTDTQRVDTNTENGALIRTSTGIYAHHGGEHVKIYPQLGSTGATYQNYETLTSGRALTSDDHVIFVDFNSEQTVTLPLAEDNGGKEYIIRVRHDSSKCVLQRSGSDNIIDDGSFDTSIDINGDKSRTLISDGVNTWYVVTSTGA